MIEIRCPVCMKLYPLHLEHEHSCQKSKPAKKPTTSPVAKTVASSVSSPSSRRITTPPEPVSSVTTPVTTPAVATSTIRAARYRTKNREAYNARMRAYRARQKAPE